MSLIIDYAIKMHEAGFGFGNILVLILLSYVLNKNMKVTDDIATSLKTLVYQNKNKYLDEEDTERFVDEKFRQHVDKKWIVMCDKMDENGFASEERRSQVREQIAMQFDTITGEEREVLNEYLTAWGSKLGTRFFAMYSQVRDVYLNEVYDIIFSNNKRAVKKSDFYSLCQSKLINIKMKLRK